MCVSVWINVVYTGAGRGQKRVFSPLELKLLALVSHLA